MTRANFGGETTTEQVLEGIDLTGKVALVTGGSSGLGAQTSRALASKGAHVIMTARNLPKAQKVIDEIIASHPDAKLEVEELELGSLASIRAFAKRILAKHERLDILINNAGVMACPQGKTTDGFELQFGTNHLGHFLMTNLLVPALAPGARVISVSSAAHRIASVDLEDPHFERRPYEKWVSYGQSKTANILFALELNKRLKSRDIEAFSLHPGVIMTDLARHMTEEDMAGFQQRVESGTLTFKSVEAGAATQVYAATAPELKGKGGAYLSDCQICELNDDPTSQGVFLAYAIDPETAQKLWQLSEELVGESFAYT